MAGRIHPAEAKRDAGSKQSKKRLFVKYKMIAGTRLVNDFIVGRPFFFMSPYASGMAGRINPTELRSPDSWRDCGTHHLLMIKENTFGTESWMLIIESTTS
ncbi:hypothetical protein JYT74_00530 [Crocinitomix catalasitica]|nr:hypothetical protein [Crocinitomix catalasitica]